VSRAAISTDALGTGTLIGMWRRPREPEVPLPWEDVQAIVLLAARDAAEVLRRERLRHLSFGLLGR
jgi:hypothetical protein